MDPIARLETEQRRIANLRDGEPCGHPGCLSHISHPCEACGRVGGHRTAAAVGGPTLLAEQAKAYNEQYEHLKAKIIRANADRRT